MALECHFNSYYFSNLLLVLVRFMHFPTAAIYFFLVLYAKRNKTGFALLEGYLNFHVHLQKARHPEVGRSFGLWTACGRVANPPSSRMVSMTYGLSSGLRVTLALAFLSTVARLWRCYRFKLDSAVHLMKFPKSKHVSIARTKSICLIFLTYMLAISETKLFFFIVINLLSR